MEVIDMASYSVDKPCRRTVSFAAQAVTFNNDMVLFDDDLERMFYSNAEVRQILVECKRQGDLPTFWCPLRIQRVYLLYNQVSANQQHQYNTRRSVDMDVLAKVSRKVTSYSQVRANRQGIKDAEEVQSTQTDVEDVNRTQTDSIRSESALDVGTETKKQEFAPQQTNMSGALRKAVIAPLA
eukprot:scaffold4531_cov103-Cylindrotheca_fusiformis.AAC.2